MGIEIRTATRRLTPASSIVAGSRSRASVITRSPESSARRGVAGPRCAAAPAQPLEDELHPRLAEFQRPAETPDQRARDELPILNRERLREAPLLAPARDPRGGHA